MSEAKVCYCTADHLDMTAQWSCQILCSVPVQGALGSWTSLASASSRRLLHAFFAAERKMWKSQNLVTNSFMGLANHWRLNIVFLVDFVFGKAYGLLMRTYVDCHNLLRFKRTKSMQLVSANAAEIKTDSTGHLFPAMEDAHLNLSSWLGRLSGNGWNPVVPMSSLMPSDWMVGNMKLPHAAWQDLLWKMKSYEIWEILDKAPSTYTVGRFLFKIFILIQVDFWGRFDMIWRYSTFNRAGFLSLGYDLFKVWNVILQTSPTACARMGGGTGWIQTEDVFGREVCVVSLHVSFWSII